MQFLEYKLLRKALGALTHRVHNQKIPEAEQQEQIFTAEYSYYTNTMPILLSVQQTLNN